MASSRPNKELEFYRRAHGFALGIALTHLLICVAFAPFTKTWLLAFLVGVPALAVPWYVSSWHPTRLISRMVMGTAFMVFTGLIVMQTRGDLESPICPRMATLNPPPSHLRLLRVEPLTPDFSRQFFKGCLASSARQAAPRRAREVRGVQASNSMKPVATVFIRHVRFYRTKFPLIHP